MPKDDETTIDERAPHLDDEENLEDIDSLLDDLPDLGREPLPERDSSQGD